MTCGIIRIPLETHRSHRAVAGGWEMEWGKPPRRNLGSQLLPVDFRSPLVVIVQLN